MHNELHDRLIAEGYTKDNPPPYARWAYGWECFEYTLETVARMVWETPCGLLRQGKKQDGCGHGSKDGIAYRPENGNLRIACPYYDEKDCPHRDAGSPDGWNCITHRTERPYDYNNSVEKLLAEWEAVKHNAYMEATQGYGFCVCMKWDRPKRRYIPRYDPQECINFGCKNEVCAVTKKTRDLSRVNIFYDVLKETSYKKGMLEFTDKVITKGIKVFGRTVARTDAEMWLKVFGKRLDPQITKEDRVKLYFSEQHGETGFGEYDWFKFAVTPQNIRIERRETRDLIQDLQDIKEGIKVVHASDIAKRDKEAYRERKAQREAGKARRIRRVAVENWRRAAFEGVNTEGEPASDFLQKWSKEQLEKRGIITAEQISIFDFGGEM